MKTMLIIIIGVIAVMLSLQSQAQSPRNYKQANKIEIAANCMELAGIGTALIGFKTHNQPMVLAGILSMGVAMNWRVKMLHRNLRVTYKPQQVIITVDLCKPKKQR